MATTPLKPKTLQEVLAEQNKVVTPTATPSPTASINQAQLEANKAKAAQREAARNPKELDWGWFWSGVTQQEWDYMSMGTAGTQYWVSSYQDYTNKYGNLYDTSGRLKASTPTINNIKAPEVPKIDTLSSPKVQTGKLVSDFNSTLKTTGSDKDAYYAGINYVWLSEEDKKRADTLFDMRQKAKTDKVNKMDVYDKYSSDIKTATDAMKTQYDADKKAMEDAAKKEKETMISDYDTGTSEYESAFTTFETEQNALLNNYESNRLNQVQWDLRRALLSRGVDISKVPPEQLIALSGDIGAKAFSDISGAKERATAAIENARQNKLAKVRELKSKKAMTEAQYNKTLADINSTANQAKNNLDLKFAETVFWINTAKDLKKETTQTNTAQAIMNTAQSLGVSGSQFGVVNKFIQSAKSTPEALQAMFAELSNPDSALYTILQSNESAAAKQQAFKNEIDLLEAQAKLKSASRSPSAWVTVVWNVLPTDGE